MKDRAELSKQLTKLRGEARLTMMASDRVKIDKKRKELQTELDAANTEISSLQKQIMEAKQSQDTDTDAGGKVKSWIDSFQSMSEAKVRNTQYTNQDIVLQAFLRFSRDNLS